MRKAMTIEPSHVRAAVAAGAALLAGATAAAQPPQPAKISYGTNWLAEAEHGGFYQAAADGTYVKYGLDVTIVQGGPSANGRLLMSSGRLDCFMGSDMINAMDAVAQGLPTIAVAGMFQKDPQVLISHPGEGLDTFESLKTADKIYVARSALGSFFQWLQSRWGFPQDNVAPYNFNAAPFLADKKSVQQGYATSEPFAIEKLGGFKPNVFLLADYGFDTASTTIECRRDFVEQHADGAQAIRHRRFGRRADSRHRGDVRRADEELLRSDGDRWRSAQRPRLQEGLHAPIRQQGRRARFAPEIGGPPADRLAFVGCVPYRDMSVLSAPLRCAPGRRSL
jgi:hypothetical protein